MVRLVIFAVVIVSCNAGLLGGYNSNSRQYNTFARNLEPTSTKSFYFFSDPDEQVAPAHTVNRISPVVKKHVQVVVIKAPEYNAYTNAAINLAKQAVQTKTVIYLLSREPDVADLERRFQQIHDTNIQKPEVRFVKYRTAEEAVRLQEAIRSQYDNQSGSSASFSGSGAPVVDYTNTINVNDDDELFTAKRPPFLPTGIDVVPGSSYLPPKRD